MNEAEFDRFADEYANQHARNIRASGESPEFFSRYKVQDLAEIVARRSMRGPLSIIDFGSGIGNAIPHFRALLPDAALTCADVSRRSLDIARSRFPGEADFQLFDGRVLPFADDSFDIGFTACVFHHIESDQHVALFRELRRVIRPSGFLIVFEHNPLNPLTVRAVKDCPFDENAVLIRAGTLADRLSQAGFAATKTAYRIFFPAALARMRFVEPWLKRVPLGAQYSVLAD